MATEDARLNGQVTVGSGGRGVRRNPGAFPPSAASLQEKSRGHYQLSCALRLRPALSPRLPTQELRIRFLHSCHWSEHHSITFDRRNSQQSVARDRLASIKPVPSAGLWCQRFEKRRPVNLPPDA